MNNTNKKILLGVMAVSIGITPINYNTIDAYASDEINFISQTSAEPNKDIILSDARRLTIPKGIQPTEQQDGVPKIWSITSSLPGEWTNQTIDLIVEAQDYSNTGLTYSFDNGATFQASNKKTFDRNQEVKIVVKDGTGKIARGYFNITNIDNTPPPKPSVKIYHKEDNSNYKLGEWTNKEIIIETTNRPTGLEVGESPISYMFVEIEDDTGQKTRFRETTLNQYHIKNLKSKSVRVGYVDEAGNISPLTDPVSIKVDTEPPVILHHNNTNREATRDMHKTVDYILSSVHNNFQEKLELSLDGGKTWEPLDKLPYVKTYNQVNYINALLRDQAGNVSKKIPQMTIRADGIPPILESIKYTYNGGSKDNNGKHWTNETVTIKPIGDTTGSNWMVGQVDGVNWNMHNYQWAELVFDENTSGTYVAIDSGWNESNPLPFKIDCIDKEPPKINSFNTSFENNKLYLLINASDDKSGLHVTEPFKVNGTYYKTNKIPIPDKNDTVTVEVKDVAGNIIETTVRIKDRKAVSVVPIISTSNPKGESWTNKNHIITVKVPGMEDKIKNIDVAIYKEIGADGNANLGEYLHKKFKYTGPFEFGEPGYYFMEVYVNFTNGQYEDEIFNSYIDKEPPEKPKTQVYTLRRKSNDDPWERHPVVYTGDLTAPLAKPHLTKFRILATDTNFRIADKLAGVDYRFNLVLGGIPSLGPETAYEPGNYHEYDVAGNRERFMFMDRAGNISPAAQLPENGRGFFKIISQTKSSEDLTDKPVDIEVKVEKTHYAGMHNYAMSPLYKDKPPYTETYLNDWVEDTSTLIKWQAPNVDKDLRVVTHKYTVTGSGTYYYYVRATEDLVKLYEFTIDNIDKLPPTINSITKSNNNYTPDPIVVSIDATDDVGPIYYSFDNGETFSEDNTITIMENTTLYPVVKDEFGRVTKGQPYQVDNIDIESPIIDSIDNIIEENKSTVTLNIKDRGGAGLPTDYISIDNSEFGTTNQVTLNRGDRIPISLIDKVGNQSTMTLSILPTGEAVVSPVITGTTPSGQFTSENVRLNIGGAILPNKVERLMFSLDYGKTWSNYDNKLGLVFKMEGGFDVIAKAVDSQGYEAISEPYLVRITRNKPIVEANWVEEWSPTAIVTVNAQNIVGEIEEYSIDGGMTWQKEPEFLITENNTKIIAMARDKLGLTSDKWIGTVTTIDNEPPEEPIVDITGQPFGIQEVTVQVGQDLPTDPKNQSGIMATVYYFNDDESNLNEYTEPFTIDSKQPNLKLTVRTYDNAGNYSEVVNILNKNILDVEVNIDNSFLPIGTGEHKVESRIINKGTPIEVHLEVDDSKAIPLVLEDLDWKNLGIKETKENAKMLSNDKVLLNGRNKLLDLEEGSTTTDIILKTGTSIKEKLKLDYLFTIIVESKYK